MPQIAIVNILFIVFSIFSYAFPSLAHGGFEFLPSSKHHQFTTFGLFIEEGDSTLLLRNEKRAWGAVGAAIALVEANHWSSTPQLILHASANVGFRFNSRFDTLLTETVDARVGLSYEFHYTPETRFLVGWTHQSGHISDDVDDAALIGSNLGNELIQLRIIHDWQRTFRFGGSLRPIIGSEPKMKFFGANQFAEWFPWQVRSEELRKATPFASVGLEEYGVVDYRLSLDAKLGVYFGSHYDTSHHTQLRFVLGYYNGIDPRLKYAQFKLSRTDFGYLGMQVSL